LAAAAAIIVPARRHHWQRPLPMMAPTAANLKVTVFFPAPPSLFPICCGLNMPKRHLKSREQQETKKEYGYPQSGD
jgi:hypothetical protein